MFKFKLITPEKTLYDDEADSVILTTEEGQIELMDGRSNLVGSILYSIVSVENGNETYTFSIRRGVMSFFTELNECNVFVLSGDAIDADKKISAEEYLAKIENLTPENFEELSSYKVKYIINEKLSVLEELEDQ